jgi:hypothetical protein
LVGVGHKVLKVVYSGPRFLDHPASYT